jgi:hypothetical protein
MNLDKGSTCTRRRCCTWQRDKCKGPRRAYVQQKGTTRNEEQAVERRHAMMLYWSRE